MKITYTHHFDAPMADVTAMLADPAFGRERASAIGSDIQDVDVDVQADGSFTTALRTSVPSTSIPSELGAFVGRDLTITYTEVWEAPTSDDHVGTFAVEIAGAPGHVAGAIGLRPDASGTELLVAGDVSTHVPFLGPMIEKAVAAAVENALAQQMAAADAWLAR